MVSRNGASRALLAVRVIAPAPLLWFLLAGGPIRKSAGKDWVPVETYVWPMMIAPIVLTVVYAKYRRDIRNARSVPDVRWIYRVSAGMFILADVLLAIFYSWVAAIPAVLCVAFLLDSLINRPAEEAA